MAITTTGLVKIILSDVRYINTLGLNGEIVKKTYGIKSVRYNNEFS